jgi:hypothetical protein
MKKIREIAAMAALVTGSSINQASVAVTRHDSVDAACKSHCRRVIFGERLVIVSLCSVFYGLGCVKCVLNIVSCSHWRAKVEDCLIG